MLVTGCVAASFRPALFRNLVVVVVAVLIFRLLFFTHLLAVEIVVVVIDRRANWHVVLGFFDYWELSCFHRLEGKQLLVLLMMWLMVLLLLLIDDYLLVDAMTRELWGRRLGLADSHGSIIVFGGTLDHLKARDFFPLILFLLQPASFVEFAQLIQCALYDCRAAGLVAFEDDLVSFCWFCCLLVEELVLLRRFWSINTLPIFYFHFLTFYLR